MNKLQMAHDYFMKHVNSNQYGNVDDEELVSWSWQYADTMFAEFEKREKEEAAKKRVEIQKLLNADNTFIEREGQYFDDVEWQPDWSLAPDWAKWWAMDKDGDANWYALKPFVGVDYFQNQDSSAEHRAFLGTLNFGYKGDWRDSLRMRPEGV